MANDQSTEEWKGKDTKMDGMKLDKTGASSTIEYVKDKQRDIVNTLGNIEEEQNRMLSANWHGTSAAQYQNISAAQHEEFQKITTTLGQVLDMATQHINSVANADNG
jgi:uncharacterized protein YukE